MRKCIATKQLPPVTTTHKRKLPNIYCPLARKTYTFKQDILTWWEKFKLKTKHFFQLEGRLQSKRTQTTFSKLHEQLNNLNPHTDQEQINIIHQKLQELAKLKTQGAHVRARIKNWPKNKQILSGVMQTKTNQQA